MIALKRGDIFTHKHYLDGSTMKPLRCKVTRVAQGHVYYRAFYGYHEDGSEWLGSPTHFPVEKTSSIAIPESICPSCGIDCGEFSGPCSTP